jgi:hypothetical protein
MATKRQAAAEKAASENKGNDYVVLSNLQHDGEAYSPGETVQIDPLSAELLLAAGVVRPAD